MKQFSQVCLLFQLKYIHDTKCVTYQESYTVVIPFHCINIHYGTENGSLYLTNEGVLKEKSVLGRSLVNEFKFEVLLKIVILVQVK